MRAAARAVRVALDAALVGYLPHPAALASLAGVAEESMPREALRQLIFPGGVPRVLEHLDTPLGRSGFVCLPVFADELHPGDDLAAQVARGVLLAGSLGARAVSLAGMIPARTGYGFEVLRHRLLRQAPAVPAVTTGHAVTAVSVVAAVRCALDATARDLTGSTVAVVGLGSIGRTALDLLLDGGGGPPERLLLCDVAGSAGRLAGLADRIRADHPGSVVECHQSDPALPAAGYDADLVVAAVSGSGAVLEVDRLRPGTIVVDDSFPHCLDTARAVARMRRAGDVLVVGGGLLDCGPTNRWPVEGVLPAAGAAAVARFRPPDTVPSCQLESLLLAAQPGLAPVHGLVDAALAGAYAAAVVDAGIRAAPLHLLDHLVEPGLPARLVRGRAPR